MNRKINPFYVTNMVLDNVEPGIRQAGEEAFQRLVHAGIRRGYPVDDSSMSGICVYRASSEAPFSAKQLKIAHLIIQEIPWLHSAGWSHEITSKAPQLYPRQRVVLNLMLDGLGRKQISYEMELTKNAVAGYIKDIYKHFCSEFACSVDE